MSSTGRAAEVRLSIPADSAYIAVPRSVVGNLAARNDFTVDAIDDLRIAVDEACALLLPHATDGVLDCVFSIDPPQLTVRTTATVPAGWVPDTDSFGWTVLTALVEAAGAETVDGRLTISLTASATASEKA
ncbi:putative anti-sigma regulatory factor, serine/threonine protein kinase [Kribbella flavida DSM 17836]|uniref:Putative anti-sigma regulatory factor, serine/threonine protein kinase n=1 Tax=Kribbella flavida (strain DSM 17836 / JCM 10339 / NBRC 14399) TaxID=479435 RepID=D2Q4W1_KRIFD|nr:ATP-binding protein [Kribbella flavida]ADB34216.1 putative anti-sigma regulatory factor, serine/threonine protein kinase [Kribbella flavida DSM 17836]